MCVRPNTKILTNDGIEEIGECAEEGKEVEIWNGEAWKRVIPFKTGSDRRFYRVEFSDGSHLDVTENHEFSVRKNWQKEFKKVNTLDLVNDMRESSSKYMIPRANIEYTGGVDFEGAYDYGFILGDGCVGTDGRVFSGVHVGSGKEDINFDTPTTWKGPYAKRGGYKKKDGDALSDYHNVYFDSVDVDFCRRMKNGGGLPRDLFSWSRRSILEFVAGWADADGSHASRGIRIYGREDHIRDVQLLLTKCGIDSSVNLMQKKGAMVSSLGVERKQDVWYVQITKTIDIPCQRLVCDNEVGAKFKGKNQFITKVEPLDVIEDSYCLYEPERGMCVFNNALTYQCNLSSINGGIVESVDDLVESAKAAAVLGTLQAGYTDFVYLDKATQEITEREALIGVSITGWMNSPDILFEEETMKQGALAVKEMNKRMASLIGINQAARCTTTKPEGNTSVILGCASGIHGEHAPMYFRNVQMNDNDETLSLIREVNPKMVEKSVWSNTGTDFVVSFPIESPEGSVYKSDLLGVKQLEYVKKAQNCWVEYGTNVDLCVDSTLRHNISNTITVDDWEEVEQYIFENRYHFAGISLLSAMGDRAYPQAPFTEVFTAKQIHDRYGDASMFASGLVVDGLKAFGGNLWTACDTANGWGETLDEESSDDLLKRDWVRRANNYAVNYFGGDVLEMTNCLKDCHNFHKWKTLERTIKGIDFSEELQEKRFTDVDTLAGAACAGGQCDSSLLL